ncbi:glucose-1-phosphate cytidylyltransferase [Prochlorococcus sp. AH-716-P05]|nr:glucose-1-phosphate cytidylyltransferase [Prochlorococcus sp. AH-716-P05]
MKAVILAGGLGSRISEETVHKPKPMIEIGGKPILWHILKIYSNYGINEFIICCGYKGYVIKEYFANYFLHNSDVTLDLRENKMKVHLQKSEPWKITLIDTGEETMTGGRLKRVREHIGEETFCFTYGDGVSDINLNELIKFHKNQGKIATLTAVQPPGRFGSLSIKNDNRVEGFLEKPKGDGGWINGGFFILNKEIFDFINNDNTVWEKEPLENLCKSDQLSAYKHHGFWHPMDTLRDKRYLEKLLLTKEAPWLKN